MFKSNLCKLGAAVTVALVLSACQKDTVQPQKKLDAAPSSLGKALATPAIPTVKVFATGFNNP
ncbi:MAG TPA: hypothetical protein VGO09_02770, partial [Flavisolibacter sp.]|nr:hypothetical protein [Flavisolibacter sp.]